MSELNDAAERIYNEHGLSPVGMRELEKVINENRNAVREAVKIAARELLYTAQHRRRRAVETCNTPKLFSPEFQESVQVACQGWYAWPMMDGTPLGIATRPMLERDAERYQKIARSSNKKAKFLLKVAAKLSPGQTVEEVLTEDQIGDLFANSR